LKTKTFIWILFFLLLILSVNFVSAFNTLTPVQINTLNHSVILRNDFDINNTIDNSSYANYGVETGTKQHSSTNCITNDCGYFDLSPTADYLSFSNPPQYGNMFNFSICVWENTSVTTSQSLAAVRPDQSNGNWEFDTVANTIAATHWVSAAGTGPSLLDDGTWRYVCFIQNSNETISVLSNCSTIGQAGTSTDALTNTKTLYVGTNERSLNTESYTGGLDELVLFNRGITGDECNYTMSENKAGRHLLGVSVAADTTPPEITYFNLTNENGCENWVTDKTNACSTSSVTPTVQFNTSENAWCAISGNSSSTSGVNYTNMGSSRNCTGAMSGEGGTTNHRCTLIPEDQLVYDTSYIYISCKDAYNNTNRTSTSGPLKLSITSLESTGRDSIGIGVQNALLSGYTNYTDLQIYARNLSNAQIKGTFDRAAKKGNKMWAFNRIGVSDSYVNMFNLTPVLYNLELANITSTNITKQVELLINATK